MEQSKFQAVEELLNHFNYISQRAKLLYPDSENLVVELLDYSENATYLVGNKGTKEKSILRVCRPNYHTKEQIQVEIEWILDIAKNSKVEVALPIAGSNGEFVQTVTSEFDNHDYHCTMYTFLEGKEPKPSDEDLLIRDFETLGEVTAHLHKHSKSWERAKDLDRESWNYETILGANPKWGKWEDGKGITPERKELFQKVSDVIKKRLEKFGKSNDRYGLIHADLRLANLLVHDNKIRVIDFDDCAFGWYLFDIASALSFIEHEPYVPKLVKAWLKGYRKVHPLSNDEEQEIPTFIMLRRLMLISWIGSRDNELTKQMGVAYTEQTDQLANYYLEAFSN